MSVARAHHPRRLLLSAVLALSAVTAAACAPQAADPAADGATRSVEHAMGTAEVPADPERVVVLDTGELDDTLALGVTPVGAVRIDVSTDYLSYLDGQTDGIEMVGTISEPNLEKIAALEPDLILSSTVRHEQIYDELDAIAPTVLAPDLGDTWKQNLMLYAEALGRSERARELLEQFERRAAAVGEEVGPGQAVSIVRFLPGQIRLYSDESFSGTVLDDMGLTVPRPARGEDTYLELSPERIDAVGADHLYVSTYGDPGETSRAAVTGGPLWSRLPAVRDGEVDRLEDDLLSGIGIQAAQRLLDRFEQDLA